MSEKLEDSLLQQHVTKVDSEGRTELMYWCRAGVPEAVRYLLRNGSSVDARDKHGQTALFYAVGGNAAPEIVKDLIAAGCNPNARDTDHNTALHGICQRTGERNLRELAQALFDGGADVDAQNGSGQTLLMRAAFYHELDLAKFLIRAGANPGLENSEGKKFADFAGKDGRRHEAKAFRRLEEQFLSAGRVPD